MNSVSKLKGLVFLNILLGDQNQFISDINTPYSMLEELKMSLDLEKKSGK